MSLGHRRNHRSPEEIEGPADSDTASEIRDETELMCLVIVINHVLNFR